MTPPLLRRAEGSARSLLSRLTPRQRQYAMLLLIVCTGVGVLTLVFAVSDDEKRRAAAAKPAPRSASRVTSVDVMSPGQQVNPVDQWIGTAGNKLAQYESERDEQSRLNKDRLDFESRILRRFSELEQRLTAPANAAGANSATGPGATVSTSGSSMPPIGGLPQPSPAPSPSAPASALPPPLPRPLLPPLAMPAGSPALLPPGSLPPPESRPAMTRIQVSDRRGPPTRPDLQPGPSEGRAGRDVSSFLPVSFTRGVLLGGIDARTGGESQANPQPVLIRLTDNSVLPSRFRASYRECFVIAAGYGDISAERVYLRTETLSCVHPNGTALEVQIKGSVFGEDGKLGMRGRQVTKQGQMLANALLAGVVSGIGQGVAAANTTVSASPLGSIASTNGTDAYRTGLGTGVGRALDRLAQYYIKLAENTFPVIEIDGGREVDVVITRGTAIDPPLSPSQFADRPRPVAVRHGAETGAPPAARYLDEPDDDV